MLIDFAWIYIVLSTSLKTRVSNSGHIFLWKKAIDKDFEFDTYCLLLGVKCS